jgi:hypothetical protein
LTHREAGIGAFEKKSPMNPPPASLDGHALVARYEALRQDVVGSTSTCHRSVRGLALFMRKGMAAWMKSVIEEPSCRAAIPATSSLPRMPSSMERSLIDIVAAMALATALEARRDF